MKILRLQYSALIHSRGHRASLVELINQKEVVGDLFNQLRLASQRRTKGRPAQVRFIYSSKAYDFIAQVSNKPLVWIDSMFGFSQKYECLIQVCGPRDDRTEKQNRKKLCDAVVLNFIWNVLSFQTLAATNLDDQDLSESMQKLLIVMQRLDQKIAPMLEADGELFNKR